MYSIFIITNLILILVQKSQKETYQLRIFDLSTKTWLEKPVYEFILPKQSFASGIV